MTELRIIVIIATSVAGLKNISLYRVVKLDVILFMSSYTFCALMHIEKRSKYNILVVK